MRSAQAMGIAAQSPRAMTISKVSLRRSVESGLDATLEFETYLQSFAFRSDEHKRRLKDFLNKRTS